MKAGEVHSLSIEVARRTGLRSLLLLGSQSLHAYFRKVPNVVLNSFEADFLLPDDSPAAAREIDLHLGRNSPFHNERGFYADVAVYGLALLPPRWNERLKLESLAGGTVELRSLDPHDLAISKLYADRPKDIAFLAEAMGMGLISRATLAERIEEFGGDLNKRALLGARLQLLPSKISAFLDECRQGRIDPETDALLAAESPCGD